MQVTSTLRQANVLRLRFQVGATGATGPTGPVGPTGPANSLAIGTVSTLPYGSPATATITGSPPTQTLDLGLPTGAQGPSGSVTDGDKGDVVVSGAGTVWTIDGGYVPKTGGAFTGPVVVGGSLQLSTASTDPGTGVGLYFVGSGSFQTVLAGAALAFHTGANNARAERMRLHADGRVSFKGNIDITASWPTLTLDKQASGQGNVITGSVAGALRWQMRLGSDHPEVGGNAGSDFDLVRMTDAGTYNGIPLSVKRDTGRLHLATRPDFNGATPYDSANLTTAAVNTILGATAAGSALLTAANAAAQRAALGVDRHLINSTAISNAPTTIDFTGLSGAFARYIIEFENLRPATDDVPLLLRLDQGGGFLTSSGSYTFSGHTDGPAGSGNLGSTTDSVTSSICLSRPNPPNGIGNLTAETVSGEIVFDIGTAATKAMVRSSISYFRSDGLLFGARVVAAPTATGAVNGVRLMFGSGAFANQGVIRFYGVKA